MQTALQYKHVLATSESFSLIGREAKNPPPTSELMSNSDLMGLSCLIIDDYEDIFA